MRLHKLAATASIAVLALSATGCKSSSHASPPAAATNAPATETQADATESPSASSSPSTATSAAAAASSASPSVSATASAAGAAAAGGEINACSLLTGAQASSLTGRAYGAGTPKTIAPGQDSCDYPYSGPSIDLTVIVYEPSSGVSWQMMTSVLGNAGAIQQVSGVGDKAMFSGIELDVATGKWLFSVQGADSLNADTGSIAIGKALVAALASK
jgi:hypothetical protein